MRLESYLLAENFPQVLDWPRYSREGRRPDFLLLSLLRQSCLWLAGDTLAGALQRVCVPSCNSSSTCSSSSNKQQKKQAAAASSSCKTSPADMAHAGMVPYQRLTQTDLTSCSLLCISTTTIKPAAQSQLHGNDEGSTTTRRRSGEGQELATYSVLILQVLLLLMLLVLRALLLRALLQASVVASKQCCLPVHGAVARC